MIIQTDDIDEMDNILKLFSFGFWDETEETNQGTTSQWARVNVPAVVDVVDSIAPKAVISPFFWTEAAVDKNSLYGGSKDNGHIELEADLPAAVFNQGNGVFDLDPKVSGKITVRGTAFDDQRLNQIWMFIGNGNSSEFDFTNTTTGSQLFDIDADGDLDDVSKEYRLLATYNTGSNVWEAVSANVDNAEGWSFSAEDDYINQSGHKVNWKLNWDTSKIDNVAATDRQIRIMVTDRRTNASGETEVPAGDVTVKNVPRYQIDVVPYISSINTQINTLLSADFNRSANGHYPVYVRSNNASYETVTINGFNLSPTALAGGANGDIRISVDPDSLDAGGQKVGTGLSGSDVATDWNLKTKY